MSNSVPPHRWQPTRLLCPWILQARTLEWVAISFSASYSKGTQGVVARIIIIPLVYCDFPYLEFLPENVSVLQCRLLETVCFGQEGLLSELETTTHPRAQTLASLLLCHLQQGEAALSVAACSNHSSLSPGAPGPVEWRAPIPRQ